MSQTIKVFDTEYEQRVALNNINENNYPLILINKENNTIFYSKDGTKNEVITYNNNEYLPFDKNDINEYFVIPNDVDNLNIKNTTTNTTTSKSISCKYNKIYNNTPLYTVGLMSDIHYEDRDTDEDPDTITLEDMEVSQQSEFAPDLVNGLQFFANKHVDFISCCGDIGTNSTQHFVNYKLCVDTYCEDMTIFTCCGNNDTKAKYSDHNLWNSVSAIDPNNDYEITYFQDYENFYDSTTGNCYATEQSGNGTSYYIKKYYNNGEDFDVYIYLNIEYGWRDPNSYSSHDCVKLTQEELLVHTEVDQENDYHLYNPQTLECLANILEEFKNHRCFIFTHPMIPEKAGNFHISSLVNQNYYAYAYDFRNNNYNHIDVLRGDQKEFIMNLMEQYDNNYWFCGHSHYKWKWQILDHNINITKTGNSYNIHLPSMSRPLAYACTGYQSAYKDSEAAIMEVYKDYVVIKGVVLKENDNDYNQDPYDLILNCSDDNLSYVTANMISKYGNNSSTVEQLENDYVQINYQYNQQGSSIDNDLYLNDGTIKAINYGNYVPVLRFEDIQIWYDGMPEGATIESVTQAIMTESKIGFRSNTSTPYLYYFYSNFNYPLYPNGINFKMSSGSSYRNYLIHVKFKAKLGFVEIGYLNKFLPIACYKLPSK